LADGEGVADSVGDISRVVVGWCGQAVVGEGEGQALDGVGEGDAAPAAFGPEGALVPAHLGQGVEVSESLGASLTDAQRERIRGHCLRIDPATADLLLTVINGRCNERYWGALDEQQHADATQLIAAGVINTRHDALAASARFEFALDNPTATRAPLVTSKLPIADTRAAEPLTSKLPTTATCRTSVE
jgi:hypothetical protein